mmetsp:Transcript_5111/g.10608  ORF Transcript_5111/g.10608 Transcript_5111/m.10608 type:complete len:1471 (+) Transcript_5111:316-4728(+)|eukprot:CAMPEP_0171572106 /NCGR_PEP_ID=MMETSP0961-20121227/3909_1 /TAXON_ID=87120 /ORGANISM="Aurantiochytrium limacinum, Strain ATCCMYA-1381" /LENGTH=1470 /DNA_ID=CAMNT_0012126857 /DNA_START=220 /DNA_END=4632 /DNA_ORIENTATION=+
MAPKKDDPKKIEAAFQALAKAGLDAVLESNSDLRESDGEELALRLESLLDSEYLSSSISAASEETQDAVEEVYRVAFTSNEGFYPIAFGMNNSDSSARTPRMQRLLFQYGLAQVLADSKRNFWIKAAQTYLALLKIPGAVSYQMFRTSLFHMVLKPLSKKEHETKDILPVMTLLCDTCEFRPVTMRYYSAGLLPDLIQILIWRGAENDHLHKNIHTALEYLLQDEEEAQPQTESDAKLRRVSLLSVDAENEEDVAASDNGDDDDDDNDEEFSGTPSAKKSKKKSKKLSSKKSKPENELAVTVERALFKEFLKVFKENKSGKVVDLSTQIVAKIFSQSDAATDDDEAENTEHRENTRALKLLEHLCFDVVDKVDARATAVNNVIKVLNCTQEGSRAATVFRFCQYLSKLSNSKEAAQRAFSAELSSAIFSVCGSDQDLIQGLAEILLERSEDKVATVRIAAVKGFVGILEALPFTKPTEDVEDAKDADEVEMAEKVDEEEINAPAEKLQKDQASVVPALVRDAIRSCFRMLRRRLADSKVMVRRASARSMQIFITHPRVQDVRGMDKIIRRDLAEICNRARDISSAIKNIALQTVSQFYHAVDEESPFSNKVASLWVETILPLVYSPEQSVQKTAQDCVASDIITPLSKSKTTLGKVWLLVGAMSHDQINCLRKCFFDLASEAKANFNLSHIVKKVLHAATEAREPETKLATWTMLDIIVGGSGEAQGPQGRVQAKARKTVDGEQVMSAWEDTFSQDDDAEPQSGSSQLRVVMLSVIMGVSSSIPAEQATNMAAALFDLVLGLDLETTLLRQALQTLVSLCLAKSPDEKTARGMVGRWGDMLKARCTKILHNIGTGSSEQIETAQRALFMVGELAILGFDPDDKTRALLPLDEALNTLAMGMLAANEVAANDDEKLSADEAILAALRPHALVATGKICLRDERTAKKATRMLIRELDQCAQSEVIRSNVIVILGDLCRRYANIVDPYLDVICGCLADPAPLVRRHALILLTSLLQEDYMKWRGVMFARYLMCAMDPDEDIRGLVRYALTEIFPIKSPNLYHGKFVDVIFGFNMVKTDKYQLCTQFEAPSEDAGMLQRARARYSSKITGRSPSCAAARLELYDLLLSSMSAPHKLEVTNKICQDILGEFLDGKLALPKGDQLASHAMLLEDCFAVLSSSTIEVKASRNGEVNETEAGGDLSATVSETIQDKMAEAKGKVLAKLEQKNYAEHVIPLMVSLYRLLQRSHSPHLRLSIKYLIKMKKSFPEELSLVLGADKVLADELEYDIQQQEKEEARKAERENEKMAKKRRRSMAPNSAGAGSPQRPTTAKKARIAPGTAARRVSAVTWQPSARDVAARTANGVLKTPIPKSHSKKNRRKSLLQEMNLGASSAPRRLGSRAIDGSKENVNDENTPTTRPTLTMKVPPLTSAPATIAASRRRKWSLTPSLARTGKGATQDLTQQLMEMGEDDDA